MTEDPIKVSIDALNAYALKTFTEDWREAQEHSRDPNLTPEQREFYRQKAVEFHAEMEKLGHKHARSSRQL